ncbi:pyrokinin-1 receptor-like [Centruroides sculpturatus]|uniref:pyrokinin-1 receptor-like n=1 Tax=Centruroides sculpturatus TaxID=218467 RepID=UPI000C6CA924|nr:pyrokinin-1 receptor-like [Centruroides sculpturatus]
MEDNQAIIIRRNLSVEDFLIETLGEKQVPLITAISMTMVYSILLVTGVVGNICTCVVITRNKYMHTATNYYLFSLAVSDLLLLILGIPQEIHQLWQRYPYVLGEVFCIFRGMTSETSTNASILTITAFTVERYMAICHPLKAHTMSKLTRAIKLIVAIWCLGAIFAIPVIVQLGIVVQVDDGVALEESATCSLKNPFDQAFVFSTVFFFMLPMTVITVLYILIAIQLRRSSISKRNNCIINGKVQQKGLCIKITRPDKSLGKKLQSSRRAVVKMLGELFILFQLYTCIICIMHVNSYEITSVYFYNL